MSYKWLDPPENAKWYKQIKPFSERFEIQWSENLKSLRENGYPDVGWITWDNDDGADDNYYYGFESNRWMANFEKHYFQEISKKEAMASIGKKEEDVDPYIGKYVEALVDRPNYGSVKKGEIGLITRKKGVEYFIDFPSQCDYMMSIQSLKNTDICKILDKLPSEKVEIPKDESLVGRKIVALIDEPCGGIVKKGEIGIIKNQYRSGRWIVSFPTQDPYYISSSDIDGIKFKFVDESSKKSRGFIVGRWYKGFKDSKKVAAKFLRISECGRYFYFSEYIRKDKGWEHYNGNWYNEPQLVECPIEEIQQYFLEGHPDKLQKKKGFNIGDKVKINKWHFDPTRWEFPVYGEIVSVGKESPPIEIQIPGEKLTWSFKEEEIEHGEDPSLKETLKESPILSKFKKGDRVVCNANANKHYSFTREGWKGEIVGVHNNDYFTVKGGRGEFIILKDCLDLIESDLPGSWHTNPCIGIWQQLSGLSLYPNRILYSSEESKKPKDSSVFNEKEFLSKPFNQLLTIKTKTKCKKQHS